MGNARQGVLVAAPIVLVAVLALALTVFLNVGKLDRTLAEVEESRLRFTLGELRATLETGLDLGLTVQGLGNAQAALEAQLRQDPDIVSMAVTDSAGVLVFSAGAAAPAGPLSLPPPRKRDWLARDAGLLTLGTTLSNNFGATAGALVLRYATAKREAAIGAIARALWLAALAAVLITGLCFSVGIGMLVRRMQRTLDTMAEALDHSTADGPTGPASALAAQVRRTAEQALHDIEAAQAHLAPQGKA